MSLAGRTESAGAAIGVVELGHLVEARQRHGGGDQLGDPIAATDRGAGGFGSTGR